MQIFKPLVLGPGIKPVSQGYRDAAYPVVPQWKTVLENLLKSSPNCLKGFLFIYLFKKIFFRALPAAYGGSQSKGRIGAVAEAAGLHHRSEQCWILNSSSKARDQTCVLVDTSQISFSAEP